MKADCKGLSNFDAQCRVNPDLQRRFPCTWLLCAALMCLCFIGCGEASNESELAILKSSEGAVAQPETESARKLASLRTKRKNDAFSNKLAVGPGDVIEITVAGVPELQKYKVRVSEDNTIAVPLVGLISINGTDEEELRQVLYKRLERPVKNPQVEVFIDQYHSREVAVVGMVQKPGLYSITDRSDTILDMVNRAGGMTNQASSRLLFIPASAAANSRRMILTKALAEPVTENPEKVQPVDATVSRPERENAEQRDQVKPIEMASAQIVDPLPGPAKLVSMLDATDPIDVDLTSAAREGQLDIPVQPGDTIIVPAAGEVMVDGWVANPGAFRIVPGMTAMSAVSAAGGALFSQTAEVLRTSSDGSRHAITVDLAMVKAGRQADIPIAAGDVVFVRRSALGAVPYAFYEIFTKFGTGMYLPAP